MGKPRLLILSFSPIATDARVLRQVNEFVNDYAVTTCGIGPQPHPEVEHIRITDSNPAWRRRGQGILLNLRQFSLAYMLGPKMADARRKLRGRRFDVVLANDLPAARIALGVAPGDRIHLDLHEYWLGIQDQYPSWRRLRIPYYSWMLRRYAAKARSFTTVNRAIAERYRAEFGFSSEVVTNAGLFQPLEPQAVSNPIRLVHSGGVNPGRRIDLMMRAVAASENAVTLDLYLMGEGSPEHSKLVRLANELGERIRVHPAVPQQNLVSMLNGYDAGIHVLAPTCTNNRLALPNKFFDFVQARIAMVTGPTEAMAEILDEHELGVVTDSFDQDAIVRAIDSLTPESVARFKENAHLAAAELAGERQLPVWRRAIEAISKP